MKFTFCFHFKIAVVLLFFVSSFLNLFHSFEFQLINKWTLKKLYLIAYTEEDLNQSSHPNRKAFLKPNGSIRKVLPFSLKSTKCLNQCIDPPTKQTAQENKLFKDYWLIEEVLKLKELNKSSNKNKNSIRNLVLFSHKQIQQRSGLWKLNSQNRMLLKDFTQMG